MKQLRVGFSRVNIDPKHGIPVRGYYVPRFSSGILDHIYANAVVFAMDEMEMIAISKRAARTPNIILNIFLPPFFDVPFLAFITILPKNIILLIIT